MEKIFCKCGEGILQWWSRKCPSCKRAVDLMETKGRIDRYGLDNPWMQWELRQVGIFIISL